MISFARFLYYKLKSSTDTSAKYWRCHKRDCLKCNGRGITSNSIFTPTTPHNHAPNPVEIEALHFKDMAERRAEETLELTSAIIRSVLIGISNEGRALLPSITQIGQTIKRSSVRSGDRAFLPVNRQDIDIIAEYLNNLLGGLTLLFTIVVIMIVLQ